jgi:hypothetical protein
LGKLFGSLIFDVALTDVRLTEWMKRGSGK